MTDLTKYVRQLTVNDYSLIEQSIGEEDQRIGFGTTKVSRQGYLEMTAKMLGSQTHTTYGCFDATDDSLISYMTFFDFPNLPYYCMTNFKVVKKFNYYNQSKNGFIKFLDVCNLKEEEGKYSFYVGRAIFRNFDSRVKTIKDFAFNAPDFWKKYIRTIEEFIPAGQPSKYEYFNKAILRGKTFDNDFIILKFTCRQEFRNSILPADLQKISLIHESLVD